MQSSYSKSSGGIIRMEVC